MRSFRVLTVAAVSVLIIAGCGKTAPDNGVGLDKGNGAAPSTASSSPLPVEALTPTVAVAPDLEFSKAKAQKGYAEVLKLGQSPVANDVEATRAGAALFTANCASCHGPDGQGDGPAGMALNPRPRNLKHLSEYHLGKGELGIFRTIKYGVDGTGMAPWEGRMTDEECWKVTNYVRSLQK